MAQGTEMRLIDNILIIVLLLISAGGWLWCIWVNKHQSTSYYSIGNILYCISYIPLIFANTYTYLFMYFALAQALGVLYFVLAYFRHSKSDKDEARKLMSELNDLYNKNPVLKKRE